MRGLVDLVLSMSGYAAYGLVFVTVALECSTFFGLIFPGEFAVVLGVLAVQGNVSLPVIMAVVSAGAIVGDSIGYAVGARWGAPGIVWRRIPN
jgi:membrane-associated protein